MTSVDYWKRHGNNNGSGYGRPQAPKALPTMVPMTSTEKKIIPPSAKNYMPVVRKPLPSKPQPSIPKQTLDRRRELQESSKGKLLSRQPMSSKPQMFVATGGRWSRFKTYSTIQRTFGYMGIRSDFYLQSLVG